MEFVFLVIQGVTMIVIVDALSSWFVSPDAFPRSITSLLTAPLYRPIRAVLPPEKMGGFDLSPLGVILALQALQGLLISQLPPVS